jgi:hypothetical protein
MWVLMEYAAASVIFHRFLRVQQVIWNVDSGMFFD